MIVHICAVEVVAIRIPVVNRPVRERIRGRDERQISCPASTAEESRKPRPKRVYMLLVLRWNSTRPNRHVEAPHDRLQATLGTQSIQLIRVCPTMTLKKQLGVLPVPVMCITKLADAASSGWSPARYQVSATSIPRSGTMVFNSDRADQGTEAVHHAQVLRVVDRAVDHRRAAAGQGVAQDRLQLAGGRYAVAGGAEALAYCTKSGLPKLMCEVRPNFPCCFIPIRL